MSSAAVLSAVGHGVARITLADALAYGRECWETLAASSQTNSPFMRWEWHHAWLESAPPPEAQTSLVVALFGPNGSAHGILPFAVRSVSLRRRKVRALTWAAGNIGCPDHLDILVAPGADLGAAVALLEELPWDIIMLTGVAEEARNLGRLTSAFARRGYVVRRTQLDSCPYIDLPGSWDEYLAGLSKSRRQSIRWQERKLARENSVVITDYAPSSVDTGWQLLRSLHQERWGGEGSLSDQQLDLLLRGFSSELAARGQLWLTSLDVNGEPVAVWHGFACGDTVYFYQSGRAPEWKSTSVGLVLLAAMIRRAIDRGYTHFDFLRGRDAYKLSWTSTDRPIYEVVVFRPGWRGLWLRGLDLAGRVRARLQSRAAFASD